MVQVFSFIILIVSVVIHEVSHGYAAYMQGDFTAYYQGRLTLNPLKHIDIVGSILVPIITSLAGFPFGWAKPVPFNPYNLRNQRWGELLVALAGPASNIIIAIIFGLILRVGTSLPDSFATLAALVVLINIGLAIFNLIPIPPLDGSKILWGFLPFRFMRYRLALERYSFLIVILIIITPLIITPQFSEVMTALITFFFTHITGMPLSL